jgi:hypothetical protein
VHFINISHHEIAQTDGDHMGSVGVLHGIPQTSKQAVSSNLAMCIAFKEYRDALLSRRW